MTDQDQPPQDPPPPCQAQQPPPTMGQEKPPPPKICSPNQGQGGAGRSCCLCIFIFLLLSGAAALTVWLIYRPHKPRFIIVSAAIYELNATSQPFILTSMQFTIVTRNPNKRVTISYNRLQAYVSYRNQQITPAVDLPPIHHDKKSTLSLSPVLGSGMVPASAEVVNGLMMDESYGVVPLRVVLLGKLRWKAGAIKTLKYRFYVRCDVWVGLKKGVVGTVPLLGAPPCKERMVPLEAIVPAAQNNVNTHFILLEKGKTTFDGQNKMCLALAADKTASVHLQLWGEECEAFEAGDIIRMENGIFSYNKNNLVLRAGRRGKIEKVGEFTMEFVETPNLSEIKWVPDPNNSNKYVQHSVISSHSRIFPTIP